MGYMYFILSNVGIIAASKRPTVDRIKITLL